jgi:tRNA dimethylallyltransferase
VPHHLIDLVTPDVPFTVADYKDRATALLRGLLEQGVPPLMVGGTRLYLKSLTAPFFEGPDSDPEFREEMAELFRAQGPEALHARLRDADPVAAARLHPHDEKRVIRALEVYHTTGKPITDFQLSSQDAEPPFRPFWIVLMRDRAEIYDRINRRCDEMLESGLIEEVQGLLGRYDPRLPALQGHGYKEIAGALLGQYPMEEGVRLLKRNTRRYAKRQLSWLRHEEGVHLVRADQDAKEVRGQVLGSLERVVGHRGGS